MTSGTTQTTTHTLDVPGATLTYDVRRNDASTEPILLLIASPMGAAGFGTLSQHFSDRTVVSYDPRGVERSVTTDPTSPVTPDVHADDVHRLVQAIGGAGRPVRQQRWRGQRARPRVQAPRGRAGARRA